MVGFKTDKFQLVEKRGIQYSDLADIFKTELLRKYNVGIVCKLRHKDSGKEFILATTHLHWNPANDYVKYAQICKMFETIENMD